MARRTASLSWLSIFYIDWPGVASINSHDATSTIDGRVRWWCWNPYGLGIGSGILTDDDDKWVLPWSCYHQGNNWQRVISFSSGVMRKELLYLDFFLSRQKSLKSLSCWTKAIILWVEMVINCRTDWLCDWVAWSEWKFLEIRFIKRHSNS